ncbi:hypothetical protein QTI66_32415 [Variovorax sp. J22R133]|uniref:hypothetical protein n=1 Tax=Variovorax brevis TaxID=3053503 RepID=UPI002574C341|nr:hypothetical protein [Variovorax sp. J22R133]MDM0116835.1 hypothetical protein [Variovorax sp. J22R133]
MVRTISPVGAHHRMAHDPDSSGQMLQATADRNKNGLHWPIAISFAFVVDEKGCVKLSIGTSS